MTEATTDNTFVIELSPEAGAMLAELAKAEGLDADALMDRAVQVYFRVMEIECQGKALMVVDRDAHRVDLTRFP